MIEGDGLMPYINFGVIGKKIKKTLMGLLLNSVDKTSKYTILLDTFHKFSELMKCVEFDD